MAKTTIGYDNLVKKVKNDEILDNSLLLYRQLLESSKYHRNLLHSIIR